MGALENVSRRAVLLGMGAGALVLSFGLPSVAQEQEEPLKFGADAMPHGWRDDPRIFVSIDPETSTQNTISTPFRASGDSPEGLDTGAIRRYHAPDARW